VRRLHTLVAISLLTALVASPAIASHGGIHPTFRSETVYFHCHGPTKLYQANWTLALADPSSYPTWDTTEPQQSVQQGAGCGAVDWGGTTNALYSAVFKGTFTGNLEDFTVRVHQLLLGNARAARTETLRLYAEIDGVPIFPPGTQPAHGRTVTVTPVKSSTGASELFEFSVTNVGFARDVVDDQGRVVDVETGGVALEDGDGELEHELLLFLGVHGTALGQNPAGHKVGTWVWDTTEVPSGITFNPPSLAAATVAADLPIFEE
jgi:hypothetical protein